MKVFKGKVTHQESNTNQIPLLVYLINMDGIKLDSSTQILLDIFSLI